MLELVGRPLADAFCQVGVFVALLVAPFGWARLRWGHRLDEVLQRHRAWGPLLAAALTMPPGCGGAIVAVALYARGAVSFGAAVAALAATMGDASWVLLAADPVLTVQLKLLLLVTGAATGAVVDALGVDPRRWRGAGPVTTAAPPVAPRPAAAVAATGARSRRDERGSTTTPLALVPLGLLPAALWAVLAVGTLVAVPTTFQLVDPARLAAGLGGVDPYLAVGLLGTTTALVVFLRRGSLLADDDLVDAHPASGRDVLRHGAHEVAFVTVWVAAAYVAWSLVQHTTGFDGSQLPVLGLVGVLVGAGIGLVPGCAVQIVFVGLFLAGGVPLPTLVANTVSQDGDALLPMLALDPRGAALATVLTTVPAVLVGSLLVVLS